MNKKLPAVIGKRLTLSKTKSLIGITNKVLLKKNRLNKIIDTLDNKVLIDDFWEDTLLEWFQNNILQENTYFPKNKKELKKIKQLNLRWNRLKKLPKELFLLEQIKILNLANNNLLELSSEIFKLKNLEEINLNINSLQSLPKEIVKLKKLKKINIKNNKNLKITDEQIIWLKRLVNNECLVEYDKYKYNLGE